MVGIMDILQAGSVAPTTPQQFQNQANQRGLLGLASGLLQASAPGPRPIGFGAALGQGLQGFQQFSNQTARRGQAQQLVNVRQQQEQRRQQEAARQEAARQQLQTQLGGTPPGGPSPTSPAGGAAAAAGRAQAPGSTFGLSSQEQQTAQALAGINPQAALSFVANRQAAKTAATAGQAKEERVESRSLAREGRQFNRQLQLVDRKLANDLKVAEAKLRKGNTKQAFKDAAKLRGEFTKSSQDFVKVRDALGRVQAAEPTPAGDIGLIFNYMKILDPGSTVREGEAATLRNAAGVPEQIRTQWNKLLRGDALGPNQRKDFKTQAGNLFKSQERFQQKNVERFTRLAERFEIEPQDVVTDLGAGLQQEEAGPVPQIVAPPIAGTPSGQTPGGVSFRVIGQ